MWRLFLALILIVCVAVAGAQTTVIGGSGDGFAVQYVTVAPSGACSAAPPIQVVTFTGAVYTCNNGTWGAAGGSTYTLPIATTSVLGGVKPDGTSCAVNGTTGVLTCNIGSTSYPGVTSDGSNGLTVTGAVASKNFVAQQGLVTGSSTPTPVSAGTYFAPGSNTSSAYTLAGMSGGLTVLVDGQATANDIFYGGQFSATNNGSTVNVGQLEGINVAVGSGFPAPIGYLAVADLESNTNGSVVTELNTILARSSISAGHNVDSFGLNIEQYQTGTGAVTGNQVGLRVTQTNSGSGTIATNYGVQISSAVGTTATYGIYIGSIAAASSRWAIYSAGTANSGFLGPVESPTLWATDPSGLTGVNGQIAIQWNGTPPASTVYHSVSITVPNGVTDYQLILPGAAPTPGNTHMTCTAAAPSVCTWGP